MSSKEHFYHSKESSSQKKEQEEFFTWIINFLDIRSNNPSQFGGKGANLARLSQANIPVPPGYCISTKLHEYYQTHHDLPPALLNKIVDIKKQLGDEIIIRSSATCEDDTNLSMAGVFKSHYVKEDKAILPSIIDIFQQSQSEEVNRFLQLHQKSPAPVEMALVIQQLITPDMSGVIYTGLKNKSILIQYTKGFGADLVDGRKSGSALILDNNQNIKQSTGFETQKIHPDILKEIYHLNSKIEKLFDSKPQDIEFICQNNKVMIVQSRPLTTELKTIELHTTPEETLEETKRHLSRLVEKEKQELGTNTAIFSDANYSELLPEPTEMDIGLHMYVWGGSNHLPGAKQLGHQEMGYLVSEQAKPIIYFIGGHTYFSIARNAGVYHLGFPPSTKEYYQTLVQEYLTKINKNPQLGSYPQMKLYLQNPTLEDLQQRFGHKAEEYYQIYQQFETKMRHYAQTYLSKLQTQQLPATQSFITQLKQIKINRLSLQELGALTMQIMEHNRTQSYVDFVHCARLGFHYSQKLINNFQQRFNISEEKAKRIYSTLNQGLEESQITKVNLEIDQAKTFKQALKIAKEKIGHYSTGEMLEIHHPAMRDCPELLINYVQGIRQSKNYSQNFEQQKQNRKSLQTKIISKFNQDKEKNQWQEIITFSQTYMALRETAKYYFCQEYLVLKDALEEIGRRTNLDKGEIYHLYPKEIISYIKKPTAMKHLITSRKQARENYRFLDMPPTIREQDIKNLSLKSEMVTNFTSLHGKFLANGETLTGVVVNIDELIQTQTIHQIITKYHQEGKKVILVANQMNLTHDPLIANADALIIKNAGLVAHGAQRARELGKGAIGGIETKVLPTGTTLIFNPKRAIIKKIK